jgi:hypothetical protein
MISVMRDRSGQRTVARSEKSVIEESTMEDDMLQGVHK